MSLADRFGVSTVAAFRRLYDLSIISDSDYYEMYHEINADFEKNIKAIEDARAGKDIPFYFHVRYVNSHGHLLPKMIVNAQSAGRITLGEACKIMNIKSKYYGDIARAVMV
jgi:Zn-dependent peptidase ImmA (M78 family)